jgi:hypothetical protein
MPWKPGQSGNPAGNPASGWKPGQSGNPKGGPGRKKGSRNRPRVFDEKILVSQGNRFRDLLFGIVADLGGHDAVSTGQYQLARRCAQISVLCEVMEKKAADGEPFDVTGYSQLTGQLSRALRVLGLKRQPRDTTPSLRDYLDAARQPDGAFKIEEGDETAGSA